MILLLSLSTAWITDIYHHSWFISAHFFKSKNLSLILLTTISFPRSLDRQKIPQGYHPLNFHGVYPTCSVMHVFYKCQIDNAYKPLKLMSLNNSFCFHSSLGSLVSAERFVFKGFSCGCRQMLTGLGIQDSFFFFTCFDDLGWHR
jgi:hypothetical protein